jgi:hypothetical protein
MKRYPTSLFLVAFLAFVHTTLGLVDGGQRPITLQTEDIVPLSTKKKVWSNAPVYYCSDPKTDLFDIERVDIISYPPV